MLPNDRFKISKCNYICSDALVCRSQWQFQLMLVNRLVTQVDVHVYIRNENIVQFVSLHVYQVRYMPTFKATILIESALFYINVANI